MSNFQFPQFGMNLGSGLSKFRPRPTTNRFLTIPGAADFIQQNNNPNNPLTPQPIPSVSRGKQIIGATGQEFPQEPSKLVSPQGTNVGLGVESGIQSPQGTVGGFPLPRAKFQIPETSTSTNTDILQAIRDRLLAQRQNLEDIKNQTGSNTQSDVVSGLKKFKQFVENVQDLRDPNSTVNKILAQIENPALGEPTNITPGTQTALEAQRAGEQNIGQFANPELTKQFVGDVLGTSGGSVANLTPGETTQTLQAIETGQPVGSFQPPDINKIIGETALDSTVPGALSSVESAAPGLSSFGDIGASLAGQGAGTAADIGASLASEFAPAAAATSAIGDLTDLIPFAGPILSFGLGLAQGQNPIEAAANTATFGLFGLAKSLLGGKPSVFDAKRKVTSANAAAGESAFNAAISAGAKSNNPDVFLKSLSVGNLGNAFNPGRSAIAVSLNLPVAIATQLGLPLPEQIPGRTGLDYEFVPSRIPAGFKFGKLIDSQMFRKIIEFAKNDPITILNSIEGSGDVAFLDQSSAEALAARNKMNAQNAFVQFLFGQPNTTYSDLVKVIQSGINSTNPEFSKLLGLARDARLADTQNQEAGSAEEARQANINKFVAAGASSPGAAEQVIEQGASINPGNVDTSPFITDIQGNRLFGTDERPLNIEPNPNHPSLVALRNAKTNSIITNKKLLDAIEKAKNLTSDSTTTTPSTIITKGNALTTPNLGEVTSQLGSLTNQNQNELARIQTLLNTSNQGSPTRTIFVPKPRTVIGPQEISRLPTLTQLRLLLAQKERDKRLGTLPNETFLNNG